MSVACLLVFTVGTASAIILAYCMYYDRKRRLDPAYRRKVHERRQRDEIEMLKYRLIRDSEWALSDFMCDSSAYMTLERCFLDEIKVGEVLITQGNISDGLSHLANAIMMCAQPTPVLHTLKESLPDRVFMPLIMKLHELQSYEGTSTSSSNKEDSSSYPDFSQNGSDTERGSIEA
ncbi:mitochondrial import receptor subunit TOM20 homolog B [Drosophila mojavensis]|uniref:Mitochondrial import receptor subunit TOM20 homolog n=1 Tax=Drosophila mojavensis TaxID=7230 RepID=B4L4Z5_DROMO|nr:mitochondrial import receptor subunit TOM20 homolog B [Drosophila mojavensis]EDW06254.1 uncharacterized protein Dmoj_GI21625 [Drosophila mojavensis]